MSINELIIKVSGVIWITVRHGARMLESGGNTEPELLSKANQLVKDTVRMGMGIEREQS
jgi:hypothetical protein